MGGLASAWRGSSSRPIALFLVVLADLAVAAPAAAQTLFGPQTKVTPPDLRRHLPPLRLRPPALLPAPREREASRTAPFVRQGSTSCSTLLCAARPPLRTEAGWALI
jgi:hypothetical protein